MISHADICVIALTQMLNEEYKKEKEKEDKERVETETEASVTIGRYEESIDLS